MCRFQEEINSKIQEKKALEIPADGSSPVACPAESAEGQGSNPGPSSHRTSGVTQRLEEASDGDTSSLEEGSSDEEQEYHCGGESVGTACQHDLRCCVQHGLSDHWVQIQMKLEPSRYSPQLNVHVWKSSQVNWIYLSCICVTVCAIKEQCADLLTSPK